MGRPRKDRPRKTGGTKEQRVWDYLHGAGPQTQAQVIEQFGAWSYYAVKDTLLRLKERGAIQHVGKVTYGHYVTVGERPIDGRGHAVKSTLALNALNKEAKVQRQVKAVKAPVLPTAFAQSLAWLCPVSRVAKADDMGETCGGNVRPELALP